MIYDNCFPVKVIFANMYAKTIGLKLSFKSNITFKLM